LTVYEMDEVDEYAVGYPGFLGSKFCSQFSAIFDTIRR
jgi:hypothetical protein